MSKGVKGRKIERGKIFAFPLFFVLISLYLLYYKSAYT